jgi:hypothetical protein
VSRGEQPDICAANGLIPNVASRPRSQNSLSSGRPRWPSRCYTPTTSPAGERARGLRRDRYATNRWVSRPALDWVPHVLRRPQSGVGLRSSPDVRSPPPRSDRRVQRSTKPGSSERRLSVRSPVAAPGNRTAQAEHSPINGLRVLVLYSGQQCPVVGRAPRRRRRTSFGQPLQRGTGAAGPANPESAPVYGRSGAAEARPGSPHSTAERRQRERRDWVSGLLSRHCAVRRHPVAAVSGPRLLPLRRA